MAVYTLVSASGSPGVTTTALALASVWPRPVIVVEADPTGGSAILAGYFRGQQRPAGLVDLVQQTADRVVGAAGRVLQHTLAGVPDLEVAVADAVAQELTTGQRWESVQHRPSRAEMLDRAVIAPAVAAAAITR
jgi:hypothetical protein